MLFARRFGVSKAKPCAPTVNLLNGNENDPIKGNHGLSAAGETLPFERAVQQIPLALDVIA